MVKLAGFVLSLIFGAGVHADFVFVLVLEREGERERERRKRWEKVSVRERECFVSSAKTVHQNGNAR